MILRRKELGWSLMYVPRTLRFLVAPIIILSVLPLNAVSFGKSFSVKELKVNVWPEYDKPSVLVFMDGWVDDSVELPTEIKISISEDAAVHMACSISQDGVHLHENFDIKSDSKGKYATFVLREKQFHLEYYYNPFENTPWRKFQYKVASSFNVDDLQINIKEPVGASSFLINPSSGYSSKDVTGVINHNLYLGKVDVGDNVLISIDYVKEGLVPSTQNNLESGTRQEGNTVALWFILGAISLATIGYIAFRTSNKPPVRRNKAARRKNVQARRRKPMEIEQARSQLNFCTDCGSKLAQGAKFCSTCGTKVRRT